MPTTKEIMNKDIMSLFQKLEYIKEGKGDIFITPEEATHLLSLINNTTNLIKE